MANIIYKATLGGDIVQKIGYIRPPSEMEIEITDEGFVKITTVGKIDNDYLSRETRLRDIIARCRRIGAVESTQTSPFCLSSYGVTIGKAAKVVFYGQIEIAPTGGSSLTLHTDGEILVGGKQVGFDPEVVHHFRSFLGQPLPGKPNLPDVWKLFFLTNNPEPWTPSAYDEAQKAFERCENAIAIGWLAIPRESSEIVIRNHLGAEFRLRRDGSVANEIGQLPDDKIVPALRRLFKLYGAAQGEQG